MRKATKEDAVNQPLSRLMHSDKQEAMQLFTPFQHMEFSAEFGQPNEALKQSVRRRHR